jgi:hypothetical protein
LLTGRKMKTEKDAVEVSINKPYVTFGFDGGG